MADWRTVQREAQQRRYTPAETVEFTAAQWISDCGYDQAPAEVAEYFGFTADTPDLEVYGLAAEECIEAAERGAQVSVSDLYHELLTVRAALR